MPLNDTGYAYAVGRIRALETRLLDKSKLERMIDAPSAEEALKVLAETEYAGAVAELADVHDFEIILRDEISRCFALLLKMSPRPELIGMMALRYDIHNLKVLFKAKYLGVTADLLMPAGTVAGEKLKTMVEEEDFRDLPGAVRAAAERVVEEFAVNRDPQAIDLNLDRVLFARLLESARAARSAFLEGLFLRQIDLANIKTFVRVKRMGQDREFLKKALLPSGLIPAGRLASLLDEPLESLIAQTAMSEYAAVIGEGVRDWLEKGTAAHLEKLADDYITAYLQWGRRSPFGFEPLIAYLWAKEIEIKNIRLIMVGKINKLPVEAIRERLRHVQL
jgi:V/A-type H+-transporting ATPase subunit C